MDAVILAAGKGERLRPFTETRPKPMMPVLGKPQLVWTLETLEKAEIKKVIIVIGWLGEKIKNEIGNQFGKIKIEYVWQKEQKGTGHALLVAEDMVSNEFLVLMGDDFYSCEDILSLTNENGNAILVSEVENPENFGVVVGKNKLEDIIEKPKNPPTNLVNTGAYKVDEGIFEILKKIKPSSRGEIELTDAIKIVKPKIIKASFWRPLTFPWDYLELSKSLMEKMPSKKIHLTNAYVKGKVWIGEGTKILEGTVIEGPVFIGKNCKIGPNAYIRPGTVIGDNCHIGTSEIKASIIMNNTNVPHFNYVGDSIIGENCNLGAGAKIANLRFDDKPVRVKIRGKTIEVRRKLGAFIGDNVKIGINASILPGAKIGSNSWIWPGKIVSEDVSSGARLV